MKRSTKSTAKFGCLHNLLFIRWFEALIVYISELRTFTSLFGNIFNNGFYVCVEKSPHASLDPMWNVKIIQDEKRDVAKNWTLIQVQAMYVCSWHYEMHLVWTSFATSFKRKRVKGLWTFLNVIHLCGDAVISYSEWCNDLICNWCALCCAVPWVGFVAPQHENQ